MKAKKTFKVIREWNHIEEIMATFDTMMEARKFAREYFEKECKDEEKESEEAQIDYDDDQEGFFGFVYMYNYSATLCVKTL